METLWASQYFEEEGEWDKGKAGITKRRGEGEEGETGKKGRRGKRGEWGKGRRRRKMRRWRGEGIGSI